MFKMQTIMFKTVFSQIFESYRQKSELKKLPKILKENLVLKTERFVPKLETFTKLGKNIVSA